MKEKKECGSGKFFGFSGNESNRTLYFCHLPIYRSIYRSAYRQENDINRILHTKKFLFGLPVYSEKIEDYVRTRRILGFPLKNTLESARMADLLKILERQRQADTGKCMDFMASLSAQVSKTESELSARIQEYREEVRQETDRQITYLSENFSKKLELFTTEQLSSSEKNIRRLNKLTAVIKSFRDAVKTDLAESSKSVTTSLAELNDIADQIKNDMDSSGKSAVSTITDVFRETGEKLQKITCDNQEKLHHEISALDNRISTVSDSQRAKVMESVTSHLDELSQKISDMQTSCTRKIEQYQSDSINRINSLENTFKEKLDDSLRKTAQHKAEDSRLSDRINAIDVEQLNRSSSIIINEISAQVSKANLIARENEWAAIFNNTIHDSIWLKDRSFSPGRWAVGYQFLYVMYRILNEIKPERILELGLGQSTRMIAQYAAKTPDVKHFVVEHDPVWIDFFSKNFPGLDSTTVVQLPWDFKQYKEAERVRCYRDFQNRFEGQIFDFISIDGPLGSDMKQYARIDTLSIIPGSLAPDFVIMIDDTERPGEIRMIAELTAKLDAAGISYRTGNYQGEKKATVICSSDWGFLTSM